MAAAFPYVCLLYTSDAADDLLCVDLGGRRIIKKKNKQTKHNKTNTSIHIANQQVHTQLAEKMQRLR